MIRLSFVLIALVLACGGPQAGPVTEAPAPAPATEVAPGDEPKELDDWFVPEDRAAMIFGNDSGVLVVVVPISSKSNPALKGEYLLRATGSNSESDGLVLRVKKRNGERVQQYVAQLRGQPFWVLRHGTGSKNWSFHGYEHVRNAVETLRPLDKPIDTELVLRLRAQQRGSALQKVEASSREENERWQRAAFASKWATLPWACSESKFSIDWSSVPDEMFEQRSIAHECGGMTNAVEDICEQHPHAAERVRDTLSFTCRFRGDPASAESWQFVHDSKGNYTYSPGNVKDEFRVNANYLRKALGETDQVFRTGDHYFVMRFLDQTDGEMRLYTGDGETFYPAGSSFDSNPNHLGLPGGSIQANLGRGVREKTWTLSCGKKRHSVETLVGAERKAILDRAKFEEEPKWKREPYFLSRDTHGTYYYVDRYKREFGGKRYRVFVGRRGQLKLTKLKGLVEDSEGTLFSTASGDLRLVVSSGTKKAIWIRGKKETALTSVRLRYSRKLIYDELGVYYGDELGYVCE